MTNDTYAWPPWLCLSKRKFDRTVGDLSRSGNQEIPLFYFPDREKTVNFFPFRKQNDQFCIPQHFVPRINAY